MDASRDSAEATTAISTGETASFSTVWAVHPADRASAAVPSRISIFFTYLIALLYRRKAPLSTEKKNLPRGGK
jgi:hypothetical protein